MRRDYDVFEKFPDGSTLWRACVVGRYEAQRTIHELTERSDNEFVLLDIQAGEHLPCTLPSSSPHRADTRTVFENASAGTNK